MSADEGTLARRDLRLKNVLDITLGDYMIVYGEVQESIVSKDGTTVKFFFTDSKMTATFKTTERVMVVS